MKVLLLVNKNLIPPTESLSEEKVLQEPWKTEYHVFQILNKVGHEVFIQGVGSEVKKKKKPLEDFRPNVVFNLLEEFDGEAVFDQNIVSYLEIMGVKYTGCNPTGLILARDKALSKKVLAFHDIKTPQFEVVAFKSTPYKGIALSRCKFPVIVKSLNEEASLGISQKSVVYNEKNLTERVNFVISQLQTDVIVEEYIEGRELYVGVLGNRRPEVFPVWELAFNSPNPVGENIATAQVKWNSKYREKHKISLGPAHLKASEKKTIQAIAKKAYKELGLSGYARFDFRMSSEGHFFLLEANPNPDIGKDDEFASSARHQDMTYEELIAKILNLGIKWNPRSGIS